MFSRFPSELSQSDYCQQLTRERVCVFVSERERREIILYSNTEAQRSHVGKKEARILFSSEVN